MATVYRRTKRRPLINNAEIKRKTIRTPRQARVQGNTVSWTDACGMNREGLLGDAPGRVTVLTAEWMDGDMTRSAPATADGKCILILAGSYQVSWQDHTGKRKTKSTRTTDKATAQRIAAKLEADVALRRDGVIDPTVAEISIESRRSVDSHLEDFEMKMKAANRDPEHVRSTISYIRSISNAAGFSSVADIDADGVNRFAIEVAPHARSKPTSQPSRASPNGSWSITSCPAIRLCRSVHRTQREIDDENAECCCMTNGRGLKKPLLPALLDTESLERSVCVGVLYSDSDWAAI